MEGTRHKNPLMIDEIHAVDWASVPGPAGYYRSVAAREGLEALARARGHTEAASASSLLAGGGIVHDHSGTVLPAAVPATPLLLRIAREGHDAARPAVWELVEDALSFRPWPGFVRAESGVRLCCAIAGHVHVRARALEEFGERSRPLLASAEGHWRVDVAESWAEGADTLLWGTVVGSPSERPGAVELHTDSGVISVSTTIMECPATDEHAPVCVRLVGVRVCGPLTGAALYTASCGGHGPSASP